MFEYSHFNNFIVLLLHSCIVNGEREAHVRDALSDPILLPAEGA